MTKSNNKKEFSQGPFPELYIQWLTFDLTESIVPDPVFLHYGDWDLTIWMKFCQSREIWNSRYIKHFKWNYLDYRGNITFDPVPTLELNPVIDLCIYYLFTKLEKKLKWNDNLKWPWNEKLKDRHLHRKNLVHALKFQEFNKICNEAWK